MRGLAVLSLALFLLASVSFGVVFYSPGGNAPEPAQAEKTGGLLKAGVGFGLDVLAVGLGVGGFVYIGEYFPVGLYATGSLLQSPSGYGLIQISSGLGAGFFDVFGVKSALLLGVSYGVFTSGTRSDESFGPCLGVLVDSRSSKLGLYGLINLSLLFTGAPLIPFIPTLVGQLGIRYSF